MKLTKEEAEMIRNAANAPDGAAYYDEIIKELKASSRIANVSMIVAILSLIVAIIAIIR